MARTRLETRKRRKIRIRTKIKGTGQRPRLTIFRSSRHIYVQVIDDEANSVVAAATTSGRASQEQLSGQNKIEQAKKVGAKIAKLCRGKGIEQVVFDRNGYKYHGRVMAVAAGAREAGLKF
jgi:large subunit ribosomal protein L18